MNNNCNSFWAGDNCDDVEMKEFDKNQADEKTFISDITEKYGEGSLDPETGVFTSNKSK